MKRIIGVWMTLCLLCTLANALAADQPFVSGVDYTQRYRDHGAVPSMLNFGSAPLLSNGESFFDVKTTTVKKIAASVLEGSMDKATYYCYAKWQYAQSFAAATIDSMLVMTTPGGLTYATYNTWEMADIKRRTVCRWFIDVTDMLTRCQQENKGAFEKGEYTFALFFNDMAFRAAKLKVT